MSGILHRTIFLSRLPYNNGNKNGEQVYRFTDFASVVTGIGQCLEPFTIHDLNGIGSVKPASFDPKDMMRRVDEISNHSPTGELGLFADNGKVLHHYTQWVRQGP